MIAATPIIALAGKAKSGKDTVGNFIASNYNGVCIGQADPMKKFCMDVFGFTEEALWGPSELREEPVAFKDSWARFAVEDLFKAGVDDFLSEVLPAGMVAGDDERHSPRALLGLWHDQMQEKMEKERALTPRFALQQLGTDWGRKIAVDMWNQYTVKASKALLSGGHSYSRAGGLVKEPGAVVDYVIVTDGRFQNEILNVRYLGGVALKIERKLADEGIAGATSHASEKELERIPAHYFTRVLQNNHRKEDLYENVRRVMQEAYGDRRGQRSV